MGKIAKPQFITLRDNNWLEKQRVAGAVVAECLSISKQLINNKTPNLTLKDLEQECVSIIEKNNCTPTFKNYRGFPGAICASVNNQVVHGIPSKYKLKEGDLVKIDVGATYEGTIGDAAITVIYGEPLCDKHVKIVDSCKRALYAGIAAIKVGERMGKISDAIYSSVRKDGFRVITEYGGHGLSNKLHADPFIDNKAPQNSGVRIQPGMVFTLEPMVTEGNYRTKVGKNGWVVTTQKINSHWEHSLYVHENKVEILTDYENKF
jgi:methionyl aminopeptidase